MGDFGMFFILIWVLTIWEYWVCENSLWFTYDGFSFPYVFTGTNLKGFPRNKEVFIWASWRKKVTATNQNIKTLKIHDLQDHLQWSSRKKGTLPLKEQRNIFDHLLKRGQAEWCQYCQFSLGILSISTTWGRNLVIFITGKREQTSTVSLYQNWVLFLFFQFLPMSYLLTG